jgi:hypothetical protein
MNSLLQDAANLSMHYLSGLNKRRVFPDHSAIDALEKLNVKSGLTGLRSSTTLVAIRPWQFWQVWSYVYFYRRQRRQGLTGQDLLEKLDRNDAIAKDVRRRFPDRPTAALEPR